MRSISYITILILLASNVRAAMPGLFPGIDALAKSSEAVAIVYIEAAKDDISWNISGRPGEFTVVVEKQLLGTVLPKRMDLLLIADFLVFPDYRPFRKETRYLVFLTTKGNFAPRWCTLNVKGSIIEISPKTNLDQINGLSVFDSVTNLRKEFDSYAASNYQKALEESELLKKQK